LPPLAFNTRNFRKLNSGIATLIHVVRILTCVDSGIAPQLAIGLLIALGLTAEAPSG
jgi:hypothetical protein